MNIQDKIKGLKLDHHLFVVITDDARVIGVTPSYDLIPLLEDNLEGSTVEIIDVCQHKFTEVHDLTLRITEEGEISESTYTLQTTVLY